MQRAGENAMAVVETNVPKESMNERRMVDRKKQEPATN